MKAECHVVILVSRNVYTKAISDVTVLGAYGTFKQAKAALQYEYDIDMAENADPLDPETHPAWLNEEHTELLCSPGWDPAYERRVYIDSEADYSDADEPPIEYHQPGYSETEEGIMAFLDDHLKEYELVGVEITDDDVAMVRSQMDMGRPMEDACRDVLHAIRQVLDDGLDDDDTPDEDTNVN